MKQGKKIGIICSHGGHLVEALQLREAFEGFPFFILTYDGKATAGQTHTYVIRNFAKNPLHLLTGVLKIIAVFLRERPNILFSTGAEIAIPSFYIGKVFFRTRLIYLECSAQVCTPSVTGKWVYPIADLFLVQWETLLKRYGLKARYAGGLI